MRDTIMRQWQMLRLIPRHPSKIATSDLVNALADDGYEVTMRTLQRDLNRFSDIFPIIQDTRSKPYGWSWTPHANLMDIPGLDSHTALAFWLARQHLEPLMPQTTVKHLEAHFNAAASKLDSLSEKRGPGAWRNKVRVLHRGPKLAMPVVKDDVQQAVNEALLNYRQLDICYLPRNQQENKNYQVHPLGLVLKDGVFYLVCSMWDYPDIRLLTLHRMSEATALDAPVKEPEGFNLDAYIASGELDFTIAGEMQLIARFSEQAAFHLSERPLSSDQTLEIENDGWLRLTATVIDTSELRWWLLGFGDQVEVLAPAELRDEFHQIARSMQSKYDD